MAAAPAPAKVLSAAAAAAPSRKVKRSRGELVEELAASAETALPAGSWSAPAKSDELAKAAKAAKAKGGPAMLGGSKPALGAREGAEIRAAKRKRDAMPEVEVEGPTASGGKRHQLKMSGRERLRADEDRFETLINEYKVQSGTR